MSLTQAVFICSNSRASKRGVRSTSLASASDGARFARVVSSRSDDAGRAAADAPRGLQLLERRRQLLARQPLGAARQHARRRVAGELAAEQRFLVAQPERDQRHDLGAAGRLGQQRGADAGRAGQRRDRRAPVDVGRGDVEVLARGDGSPPLKSFITAATSTLAGAGARSGVALGMKLPRVRLLVMK